MYKVSSEPISLHVPLILSAYPSAFKSRKKKASNLTFSAPSTISSPSLTSSYVIALASSGSIIPASCLFILFSFPDKINTKSMTIAIKITPNPEKSFTFLLFS